MNDRVTDFLSRPEVIVGSLCAAIFLVLFWVIRGVPPGKAVEAEPDGAPSRGYQDRAVSLAILGFLTILGGAYTAAVAGVPWSIPVFAIGYGIVGRVIRKNREYRHVSPTLMRVVSFSNAALTASLTAGILVVLNVFAFKYGGKPIDLTHDEAFTLSSLSTKQMETLDQKVTFTLFFGQSASSSARLDRMTQLLATYKSANPSLIEIKYVNPYGPSTDYEALVKRAPDVAATSTDGLLIEYGDGEATRRSILGIAELFEVATPPPGAQESDRFRTIFRGEDAITSALIRLREGKRSKVIFTTGHGEPLLDQVDPRQPGLGVFKSRLASVGADAVELNLLREDIPEDAALLFIVGPESPFGPEEVRRIREFVGRGKPLILLANRIEKTGLEDLFKVYNITYGPGLIVDPRFNYARRPDLVLAAPFQSQGHPIVDSLKRRYLLVPRGAPIQIPGATAPGRPPESAANVPGSNPAAVVTSLALTSDASWAETDQATRELRKDEGQDAPGPLSVAAAVSMRSPTGMGLQPRLVVVSSPLVAFNAYVESEPTNLEFLMNAVHWLRGKPEMQGIAPKTHEARAFTANPALRSRLILVPTVLALTVILCCGVTTYLSRRV